MIFFDLDDTLIDFKKSESIGIRALYNKFQNEINGDEETFEKQWRDVSKRNYSRYLKNEISFSEQRIERVKEIFAYSGVNLTDRDAEIRFTYYKSTYEKSWSLFDDVIPSLQELKGYRLGLITNGDFNQQLLKLQQTGLKDFFSVIVISDEAGIAKPDQRIFEMACKKANEAPNECYYIGDNLETDIFSCIQAGMHGVWINREGRKPEHKDFYTIENINQLKSILESEYIF